MLVTRHGEGNHYCKLVSWANAGSDLEVQVACYAAAGVVADAEFSITLLGNDVLGGRFAFALADQPTRGLDVGAVAFVHGRLLEARRRGAAIVLISEDLEELLRLADRVAVLHRGRLSASLPTSGVTVRELGLLMTGQQLHAA